ncbi:hypothetical protein EYF80_013392 [Liparis tanakae]|uniref:Uncharacterized protein n=1 Tax=Liparis tanakae TaxID=230148 RepID=A0A4Z2IGN4_9TELE|nr:hypothetical protein EYF80_013392 [Liparis tanakae]
MPCMPRIADCGGLMIGVPNMDPNTPPLLMRRVPERADRQRDTAKGRFRTGVDGRLVRQGVGGSLHERRHEAQLDVVLLQEGVFVSVGPYRCSGLLLRPAPSAPDEPGHGKSCSRPSIFSPSPSGSGLDGRDYERDTEEQLVSGRGGSASADND